MVRLKSNWI